MSKKEKHYNKAWLKRARLTNDSKSIRDMEVEFKPGLNIIIGKNGSGKTNLMDYLSKIVRPDLFAAPGKVEFTCYIDEKKYDYQLTPNNEKPRKPTEGETTYAQRPRFERQYRKNDGDWWEMGGLEEPFSGPEVKTIYLGYHFPQNIDFVTQESGFHFSPTRVDRSSAFAHAGALKQTIPFVEVIISSLLELEENHQILLVDLLAERGGSSPGLKKKRAFAKKVTDRIIPILDLLQKELATFTPIKGLRLKREFPTVFVNHARQSIDVSDLQIEFLVEGDWLTFDKMSDGTKRLFVLVSSVILPIQTILLPENPLFKSIFRLGENSFPKIILLEEPELGIHPHQLFELMNFLKGRSAYEQIIVTTHSPIVMDVLAKDELDRILVCRYTEDKGTKVSRLGENTIRKINAYLAESFKISDAWMHSPNFEPND